MNFILLILLSKTNYIKVLSDRNCDVLCGLPILFSNRLPTDISDVLMIESRGSLSNFCHWKSFTNPSLNPSLTISNKAFSTNNFVAEGYQRQIRDKIVCQVIHLFLVVRWHCHHNEGKVWEGECVNWRWDHHHNINETSKLSQLCVL